MEAVDHLERSPIVEAIVEFRFDTDELPEMVVGRLASAARWADFSPVRLPLADMPAQIRQSDPAIRFQPIMELHAPARDRIVKLGPSVMSVHATAPYPGWSKFRGEIQATIDHAFAASKAVRLRRIGFRYINVFKVPEHNLNGASDLEVDVKIAGHDLEGPFNLNYLKREGDLAYIVRIASAEFVEGPTMEGIRAVVDIDVYTPDDNPMMSPSEMIAWIGSAHDALKREFFKLIPMGVVN